MGTPAPDADGKLTEKLAAASLANPEAHQGNGNGGAEAADDDDDDDAEDGEEGAAGGEGAAKKKKKKGKKSGAAKKKAKALKEKQANGQGIPQTSPEPTIGLSKIWPNGDYPEGLTVPYDETKFVDDARSRTTPEELRERERLMQEGDGNSFAHIRKAAEVHRQVRKYARGAIQPGMTMTEIANLIEDKVRLLSEHDPANPFAAGMGFPTGLSLNECAAHYTPNAGDKRGECERVAAGEGAVAARRSLRDP